MVDYISWCFLACFKVMARQAFWSIVSFTVASYLVTWQSVKGTDALNMITSPAKVQRVKQLEKAHCPPTVLLLSMHQTPITFPCLLVLSPDLTPAEGLLAGAPNGNFRENICSEDNFRTRIFGTLVVKFLACLPLLGFSNIYKMV